MNGMYEAVINQRVTHPGDPRLARHVGNAVVKVDARGTRLAKETKNSTRKVDLALAAAMALNRAAWHAQHAEPMIYVEA